MSRQSANFGRQRQEDLGRYLREKREGRDLLQQQVAHDLGINLNEIEKGTRVVTVKTLIKLAEKYDVPLEEMLQRKYSPQLPLLTGMIRPAEVTEDLLKEIRPEEMQEVEEEVTRYRAFLLLRRATANKS